MDPAPARESSRYSGERIERLRRIIDASIPDCLVTEYEPLIAEITLPDLDDRHVVAAAIPCEADMIVTFNERDFPPSVLDTYHLKAVSPDIFIIQLLTLVPDLVCQAVTKQRANLSRPPLTMEEYLNTLRERGLPNTARLLPEICQVL